MPRLTIVFMMILLLGIVPPLLAKETLGAEASATEDHAETSLATGAGESGIDSAEEESVPGEDEETDSGEGEETVPGEDEETVPGEGEETVPGEDEETDPEEEEAFGEEEPHFVDRAHKKISTGILGTAAWLDSFFVDPRVESEQSETRLKIRFSYFAEDDQGPEAKLKAKFRLDLPVLEDKLHLIIAGDPEDEDEGDFENLAGGDRTRPELNTSEDDFSTSLRYFLERTVYRNTSLRSGVRWRSGVPVFYLEPRFRQTIPLDPWILRFTQRVFAFSDGRLGARTTIDFERDIGGRLYFRSTADGAWASDEDGYFYSVDLSLFQRISSRRALSYNWGNFFRTQPENELEAVVLSVRYRQRIVRDWLFYEVIPRISFPEDRDYTSTPGILLRLEMLFGHYPKLPPPPE